MINIISCFFLIYYSYSAIKEVDHLNIMMQIKNFENEREDINKKYTNIQGLLEKNAKDIKKLNAMILANNDEDNEILILKLRSRIRNLAKNRKYYEHEQNKFLERTNFLTSLLDILKAKEESQINQLPPIKELTNLRSMYPVEDYSKIHIEDNGGVSFWIDSPINIRGLEDGKVVYVDNLTTFGKLLMIQYKNNWRSVYLGPIETTLEKGSLIVKGDIIGELRKDNMQKLYYELRHGDKIYPIKKD